MRLLNMALGKLFAFLGVVLLIGSPVVGIATVLLLDISWWHALWIIPAAFVAGFALVFLSATLFTFIAMLDDPTLSFARAWDKVKKDNAPPPTPSPQS